MATFLSDRETNTTSNIYSRLSTNPENLVKIGQADSEISLLQAIVKNMKMMKKKESNNSKM